MTNEFQPVVAGLTRMRNAVAHAIRMDQMDVQRFALLAAVNPALMPISVAAKAGGGAAIAATNAALVQVQQLVQSQLAIHADVPERKRAEAVEWRDRAARFNEASSRADALRATAPGWLGESQAKYRDTASVCSAALGEMSTSMTESAQFCETIVDHHKASYKMVSSTLSALSGQVMAASASFGVFWQRCTVARAALVKAASEVVMAGNGQVGQEIVAGAGAKINSALASNEYLTLDFRADPALASVNHSPAG